MTRPTTDPRTPAAPVASVRGHAPSVPSPSGGTEGPRSWVIELPPGTVLLTSNHRLHRMQVHTVTQVLKGTAITLARKQGIPRLERATVLVSYLPPPRVKRLRHPLASARVEDPDALTPTSKALIDGLTQAGVWASDSRKHVLRVTHQLEDGTCPRGRLRLFITEAT